MINHIWGFSNEHGARSVCDTCRRIEAFGAIRRAAEVAQEEDRMSDWPTQEECSAFYKAITDPTKTFWLGVAKERQENRAAAFGAIRRAAEVARRLDDARAEHVRFRDWESEIAASAAAEGVRCAIRVAIGSEKA